MDAHAFPSPDALVAAIQQAINRAQPAEAVALARGVEQAFPQSAAAHHAAGLAHEHHFLDQQAAGERPATDAMEAALALYRRAAALQPDALSLADRVGEEQPRGEFLRAAGVAASNRARLTRRDEDWTRAEQLLLAAPAPGPGREAFFHDYYLGVALREAGQRASDPDRLRRAARHLTAALMDQRTPALVYLLVDCLLQLPDPHPHELEALSRLVPDLAAAAPEDPLAAGAAKRWEVFRQLHSPDDTP